MISAGQQPLGWREVPVDLANCGNTARDVAPEFRQLLVGAGPERARPGRLRAAPLRRPPDRRARRRARPDDLELLLAHPRLQGHAHRAPARPLLRRPARPRAAERARGRPLALFDQHLPELGAGAAAAPARPQRRDQHDQRQRPLDAGARSGAALRALRRRPRALPAADPRGQLRLVGLRPRPRAAAARRPLAAARDDDDDPGRAHRPRRHGAGARQPSTATAPRCSSPGTAPRRWPSPTGASLGACLDRNGLRPGRWLVTDEGVVVVGSEAGDAPGRAIQGPPPRSPAARRAC